MGRLRQEAAASCFLGDASTSCSWTLARRKSFRYPASLLISGSHAGTGTPNPDGELEDADISLRVCYYST